MDAVELNRSGIPSLSTREEEVLSFAAAGYLDKQIGVEMGISLNTLRTYWQRIRSKIGDAPRAALAVAYSEHLSSVSGASSNEDPEHDWEVDLASERVRRTSTREISLDFEVGIDFPFEEVLATFHPEDQPRVRSLLASVKRGDLRAFTFTARRITPDGILATSAFVQVELDGSGRPVKAVGTRIPTMALQQPGNDGIQVGYWTRDLQTGSFWSDKGFREIFQIAPTESDVREAAFKRFHPDEVEHCRTFVSDAVAAHKDRIRRTHRLVYDDGTVRWISTDLRIEYESNKARRALGTVMAFS